MADLQVVFGELQLRVGAGQPRTQGGLQGLLIDVLELRKAHHVKAEHGPQVVGLRREPADY